MSKDKSMSKDKINQTYCLIATGGHLWMEDYFDTLPVPVRRRMRSSFFNICPACLQIEVLPKVQAAHPNWSREKMLITGIEFMELQIRLSHARDHARDQLKKNAR
jgi:hypothetical protein